MPTHLVSAKFLTVALILLASACGAQVIVKSHAPAEGFAGTEAIPPEDSSTGVRTMTVLNQHSVRRPSVAGMFYPGRADELSEVLDDLFSRARRAEVSNQSSASPADGGRAVALVVPHAGYVYSGFMAARAYLALAGRTDIDRVILIGAHHRHPTRRATVPRADFYATPMGSVKVDPCVSSLPETGPFDFFDEADHSLEVQLPFLQKLLARPFTIVPVLLGMADDRVLSEAAGALAKLIDDRTIVIASSDFTHFGTRFGYLPFKSSIPENLKKLDLGAVDLILGQDEKGFADYIATTGATICGEKAIRVLMKMICSPKVSVSLAGYDTSGAMTGDFENSVSYAGIVFRQSGAKP